MSSDLESGDSSIEEDGEGEITVYKGKQVNITIAQKKADNLKEGDLMMFVRNSFGLTQVFTESITSKSNVAESLLKLYFYYTQKSRKTRALNPS